jgi:hypothetical protein
MESEVVNPFLSLRLKAGLTLGELATYSQVNIRALSRSEYGMYTNPLPTLVDYWVNKGAISEGILYSEYEYYKIAVRRFNKLLFGTDLNFDLNSNIHPLRQLRKAKSYDLVELCKALCVPLDTLQYFEKKWRLQKSVPKCLSLALNQAGYSRSQLYKFSQDYSEWRIKQQAVTFHD